MWFDITVHFISTLNIMIFWAWMTKVELCDRRPPICNLLNILPADYENLLDLKLWNQITVFLDLVN